MCRIAVVVVTHEVPDDVCEYERMWLHMNEDAALVFRACSRATLVLWDAIARAGPPPFRCALRRIRDYYVIHINIFHAIEKGRADRLSCEDEGFRRVREGFCPYGEVTSRDKHSFHTVFCRAVNLAAGVAAGVSARHVKSIAFFDEQVVARASSASAVRHAFENIHTHERISILCDHHVRVRGDVENPESERDLLGDRGRAEEETTAVQPCAFVVPSALVRGVRNLFDAASEEERAMCYTRIRRAFRPQEIRPPAFWQLHDYLAPHHLPFECDSIEDAIVRVQRDVLARAPPAAPGPVPAAVHQIWVGGDMPQRWSEMHEKTRRIHGPDRTTLHGNADLHHFGRTLRHLPLFTSYAGMADAMRLEVLYARGGFYIDTDFLMFHPLFPLARASIAMVKEYIPWSNSVSKNNKSYHCCGGFIAAPRHSLHLLLYLSFYARFIVADRVSGWASTISAGSYLMQNMYRCCKHLFNSTTATRIISLVPTSFLFDTTRRRFESAIPGSDRSAVGRHLYAGSWT
jgi:hypothetical protein